jgi:hypothetical protein
MDAHVVLLKVASLIIGAKMKLSSCHVHFCREMGFLLFILLSFVFLGAV